MSRQIQLRRGTTAQNNNFTGAEGEVTFDTDAKTLRLHDGVTPGGTALARQSDIPTVPDVSNKANTSMNNLTAAGKATVAGMGFPSSKTVEINLGLSPHYYTAPANGFVIFARTPTGGTQYNSLVVLPANSDDIIYRVDAFPTSTGVWGSITAPVQAGYRVKIEYNTQGTTKLCKFVYAEGCK